MTDTTDQNGPAESYGDLPIQPTGSGVADLEIAYEQMKLAEGADGVAETGGIDGVAPAMADPAVPTDDDPATRESAAHPS